MEFEGLWCSNYRSVLDAAPVQMAAPLSLPTQDRSSATLIFVDADLADRLVARPGSEVYVLSSQDAIAEITQTLLGRKNIGSLHIVSHGQAGALQLGQTWVDGEVLNRHATALQSWSQALSTDADILLYGCDVAAGSTGLAFVQQFAQLTGADLAASNNLTGEGGDWTLEVNTGEISAQIAFDAQAIAAFRGTLAIGVGGTLERYSSSKDGQYVVFTSSSANLTSLDSARDSTDQDERDVFLYDRTTNQTYLVSHRAGSTVETADAGSFNPVISANGRYVAFVSRAKNLIDGGVADAEGYTWQSVYVWDRLEADPTKRTKLVSRVWEKPNERANDDASDPVISDDGEAIAFTSGATNISNPAAIESNGSVDVFYWSRNTDTIHLVTRTLESDSSGRWKEGDRVIDGRIVISGNGDYVAFSSSHNNLVNGDINSNSDIFRWQNDGTIDGKIINITPVGTGRSSSPDISFDGSRIVFVSQRADLVAIPDETMPSVNDVFVWKDGQIELVSINKDGTKSGLAAYEVDPGGAGATNPLISSNGKFVVFTSNQTNLTNDNTGNANQVFVRDLDAQTTVLASQNTAGVIAAVTPRVQDEIGGLSISDTGTRITFVTKASNLVAGDDNNAADVFVRDLAANTTTLISRDSTNAFQVGNQSSGADASLRLFAFLSRDGESVGFVSNATNLEANHTYQTAPNVYFAEIGATAKLLSGFEGTLVKLEAINAQLVEDGVPRATYRIQRNKTVGTLTVKFRPDATNSATAADYRLLVGTTPLALNGQDYEITFADGVGSMDIHLEVVDDIHAEADETLKLNLIEASGYGIDEQAGSVTGTIDANDTIVINTAAAGEGSLRQAILNANEFAGLDVIGFQIAGAGVQAITLNTALDPILETVQIKGSTQTGFTNTPLIELNGSGVATDGFVVDADNVLIEGLTIRNFSGTGIRTTSGRTGVQLLQNQIYDNGGLGIDVDSDGQTSSPIALIRAQPVGNDTVVKGTYTTTANTQVQFDFFSSPTADASGFGEGQTFLASASFTSDANGRISFTHTILNHLIPLGQVITATATTTSTTEFSPAIAVIKPKVSISPVTTSTAEGDSGTVDVTFTVSLDQKSSVPVTVRVKTADGSASSSDYTAVDQLITFDPEEDTKTVTIQVKGDLLQESSETFTVTLSEPTNADLGTATTATATILDDDVTVSIQPVDLAEGNSGTTTPFNFVVKLSAATTKTVTVNYSVLDDSAKAGEDFTLPTNRVITFDPGETEKMIAIAVNADSKFEGDEQFSVVLDTADGAAIDTGTAIGMIRNDDSRPTITIRETTTDKSEGNTGSKSFTYDVELSNASDETVTVSYSTADASATAGSDYDAIALTPLTFNSGETKKTITVNVKGDISKEDNETFTVTLSNANNGTLGTTSMITSTIQDDETAITIQGVDQAEGTSGTPTPFNFLVKLSNPSTAPITVTYRVVDDSAKAGEDFTLPTLQTVTFDPGETEKMIAIAVAADRKFEGAEQFSVVLESADSGVITTATAIGVIRNDDSRPTISIRETTIDSSEGNTGNQSFTYDVELSDPSDETVTVSYATADGSATAGSDYDAIALTTLTFNPGETKKTITVNVNGDLSKEENETFTVTLSNPNNGTLGTASVTSTIQDDDVAITIQGIEQDEGNSGTTTPFNFLVKLSNASAVPITVTYRVVDDSAKAGEDFTLPAVQTVTFNPGETEKMIAIAVNADRKFEGVEQFSIVLESADTGVITTGTAIGMIRNDDTRPTVSIRETTTDITEGNTGGKSFTYDVELSNASDETVTVSYATVDGIATVADNDYTAIAPTVLTFNAGETKKTITVTVQGDLKREQDETFAVQLSSPTNADLGTARADSSITNDDGPPVINIISNSIVEGDSGQNKTLKFTVELTSLSDQPITVDYSLVDGSAKLSDSDYTATSGTLTFAPGEFTKEISVTIIGDNTKESDETFQVVLQNPSAGATLGVSNATGTITDNDRRPTISIDGVSAPESKAGGQFVFTVQLSNANDQPVTVKYRTVDDRATIADNDYTAATGTLTFAAGETQKTITVNINNDDKFEPEEQFFVELYDPLNADLSTNAQRAAGTIGNDDNRPTISISAQPQSQPEGDTGSTPAFMFEVSLSNPSDQSISVDYRTQDIQAIAGQDYTATSGTLTFAAGETKKTFIVYGIGDSTFEPNEDFRVALSNVVGDAVLSAVESNVSVTLTNDDQLILPTISIDDVSKLEGGSSTTAQYSFTVRLSKAPDPGQTVTVNYETQDGSATIANSDYSAASGQLTFNANETEKTVIVTVRGDDRFEPDESFDLVLTTPTNATLARDRAKGFIRNDDARPVVSITSNKALAEGAQGQTGDLVFNVSISNSSDSEIKVNYTTEDGEAKVSDNDYQVTSGTLTFAPGQTQQTITVRVNGDNKFELEETLKLKLTSVMGADLSAIANTGTGTLLADDFRPSITISGDAQVEGSQLSFPVRLSNPSSETITVRFTTRNGFATDTDSDYVSQSGVITFLPGETEKIVTIQTNTDTRYERNETFTVELSEFSNATLSVASAIGTIQNDDPLPQVRVSAADTKPEGDAGVTSFTFTVSLNQASPDRITVNYSVTDGTATLANNDFANASGLITFEAGETQKTVTVNVIGDRTFEPNETFQLTLTSPVNATLGTPNASATIENDDRNATPLVEDGRFDVVWRNGQSGENQFWLFSRTVFGGSTEVLRVVDPLWEIEAAADFDGDGDGDILWRNYNTGDVILWRMNRDQVDEIILLPQVADLGWRIKDVGDFNGDRKTDIVWRNGTTGHNAIWLMNNFSVTDMLALTLVSDLSWEIVGVGDVDGDRDSDLIWRNSRTGENVVWQIQNGRTVAMTALTTVSDVSWQVADIGDFNNDGLADILWRNQRTADNSLWFLNGARLTSYMYLPPLFRSWQIEKVGDFNSDNQLDILWRDTVSDELMLWWMNGTSYGASASLGQLSDRAWKVEDVGDFDLDRRPEVLLRNYATGENAIWDVKINTFQTSQATVTVNDPRWEVVATTDFDQDGQGDLLWRHVTTGSNIIWFMNGDKIRELYELETVADQDWVVQGTGDINGDSYADIVWRNMRTGDTSVWFLNAGKYNRDFAFLLKVADFDWKIEAVGEFSGDRNADILWRNSRTGDVLVWAMDRTGRTVNRFMALPQVTDLNWSIRGVGDFNNDGKLDLVWRNPVTQQTSFWLMNFTSSPTGVFLPYAVDASWDVVGVGDFNGDGTSDLLWRNQVSGKNALWYIDNGNYGLGVFLSDLNISWKVRGVADFKGEAS